MHLSQAMERITGRQRIVKHDFFLGFPEKWFCRLTEHWEYLLTLTELFSCLLRTDAI